MNDETLAERYQREHATDLAIYARMTPEQIEQMAVDLNNALAAKAEIESMYAAASASQAVFEIKVADELTRLRAIRDAAENLIKQRGRYNTEQAYKRLLVAVDEARMR